MLVSGAPASAIYFVGSLSAYAGVTAALQVDQGPPWIKYLLMASTQMLVTILGLAALSALQGKL